MVVQNGKTAIVTDAAGGIGAAIARRLGRDGFAVVVSFAALRDEADVQVTAIRALGGRAAAVKGDVSDPQSMRALFDSVEAIFASVDVLVTRPAIMSWEPIACADSALLDRHVATDLGTVFDAMRQAARRLRIGGRLISLSPGTPGLAQPNDDICAATQAEVGEMTRVLASEMRTKRVTVNTVAFGSAAIEPDGCDRERAPSDPSKDIVDAVAYLAGPDSGWANGQIIRISGGAVSSSLLQQSEYC
jgi:3-oxoacyl-[acyl-carrier protein] reductase